MKNFQVNFNSDFELIMDGPKGRERLKINGEYPNTVLSRCLFSNLGLMHLIAPYFPEEISTDFQITSQMKELISAMYASENHRLLSLDSIEGVRFFTPKTDPNKVVIAYSAGKDSMWNLWWASEKYGMENVLVAHIKGLNRCQSSEEVGYIKRQQKHIGFNLKIIDLLNGSRNCGFQTMRSRDMFLTGIIIPFALEFGASKIIIEGFIESDELFTGKEENMKYFNDILKSFGISVQVAWRNDRKEMDCVKDLILNRPEWLKHICNCFSNPAYKISLHKSWQRRTPTFPLYDSQCGSCVKCRIINIARILYDPEMKKVKPDEIRFYLQNTAKWIKEKLPTHADMINRSFREYFNQAVEKYGLNNLKSSQE